MTEVVVIHIDTEEEIDRYDASAGPFQEYFPCPQRDKLKLPDNGDGLYQIVHKRIVLDGVDEIRYLVRELNA